MSQPINYVDVMNGLQKNIKWIQVPINITQ
jgi:hypothetical protein